MQNPTDKRVKLSLQFFSVAICLSIVTLGLPKVAFGDENQTHGHHEGHWSAPPEAADRQNPIPREQASIERGRELFQNRCALCHGTSGHGDGPAGKGLEPKPANLAEMSGHHSDGDIAWKIATAHGPMPALKDVLSENEIWDLTNFIKSLSPHHD